jgi:hypothetical protein
LFLACAAVHRALKGRRVPTFLKELIATGTELPLYTVDTKIVGTNRDLEGKRLKVIRDTKRNVASMNLADLVKYLFA